VKEKEITLKIKLKKRKVTVDAEIDAELKRQRNERGGAARRAGNPTVKLNNLLKAAVEMLKQDQKFEPFVAPVRYMLIL